MATRFAARSGASTTTGKTAVPFATVLAVGFMLFSMYFGAGNLIFPPMIGVESGENFIPAMAGFVLTGVALPVITILAVAIAGSGIRDLANRAGVTFGLIFSVVAYLSIGSFYAMPRAAAIGYELGVETTLGLSGGYWRLLGTSIFFAVAFVIVLFPGKVADTIGKALTPMLLILLVVLTVVTIRSVNEPAAPATEKYADSPLIAGIFEGYFTMDSIGALAFAIIVVTTFGSAGVTSHKSVVKLTAISASIAGGLLLMMYVALGVMGTRMPDKGSYEDGAAILSVASKMSLGTAGDMVFSGVVLLACLTTAVGLITASASFFNDLVPGLSYRKWAVIFTLTGLGVTNLGLERILSLSGPIIALIYPAAIALIAVSLFNLFVRRHHIALTYRTAVYTALMFSTIDLLTQLGAPIEPLTNLLAGVVPLFAEGLGWIVPTILTSAVAFALDMRRDHRREVPLIHGEIEASLQTKVAVGAS